MNKIKHIQTFNAQLKRNKDCEDIEELIYRPGSDDYHTDDHDYYVIINLNSDTKHTFENGVQIVTTSYEPECRVTEFEHDNPEGKLIRSECWPVTYIEDIEDTMDTTVTFTDPTDGKREILFYIGNETEVEDDDEGDDI